MRSPDQLPRLAKPFVLLLVAAMFASAYFVWEPWPLTSFRLFSHLRHDEQTKWEADAVGEGLPAGGAPVILPNLSFAMTRFEREDEAGRDAMCRAWVGSVIEELPRPPDAIQISRRTWLLSERKDDRALPGTSEVHFTCTARGLDPASPGLREMDGSP